MFMEIAYQYIMLSANSSRLSIVVALRVYTAHELSAISSWLGIPRSDAAPVAGNQG